MQMDLPVEASGGQEQYYIRSGLHLLVFHRRDLCDARAQPEMSSKFQMRHTSPIGSSGGQEQYYIRSSLHSEECN